MNVSKILYKKAGEILSVQKKREEEEEFTIFL